MARNSIDTIMVCGGGLAGHMCALALARILPLDIDITLVELAGADVADTFYGNVTAPTLYSFLHNIGISEPELLLDGTTTFSFGTHFKEWGALATSWIQSFHLPLHPIQGVGFHHFITRRHAKGITALDLEPYLISVQAAHAGTFAHPPTKQNIPLARAEHGYHFSPRDWARIFANHVKQSRVTHITSDITDVNIDDDNISSLTLENGNTLEADLFLDCTGPEAMLISDISSEKQKERKLGAISSEHGSDTLNGVCRALKGTDFGWQSETPLQGATSRLTVFDPADEITALKAHGPTDNTPVYLGLGSRDHAWVGNCVAIGHAAGVFEPLTPAPMMLLQRDIERLLELIPVTKDMKVERREYNRRFEDDFTHAMLFQRALFEGPSAPDTAYFRAARAEAVCDKLRVKLAQFESRGIFVQYDNEVFNEQDWTMLHYGMGRTPKRYDPLTDRVPEAQIEKTFFQMRTAIKQMAECMPPHGTYLSRLKTYLKENHAK